MLNSKQKFISILLSVALSTLLVGCPPAENGPVDPNNPKPAELDSIEPNMGPTFGGTQVILTGKNFKSTDRVHIGDVDCVPLQFISETELRCLTGQHAEGTVDVVLYRNDAEESVLEDGFTYGCSPSSPGISVWANDGGDKVTQDELRSNCNPTAVTSSVWDGTKIKVFGAKNEVVSFNLVIESAQVGAQNVSVKFDTLTREGGGGTISSIPADGDQLFNYVGRNIELFYVKYLEIKGLSRIGYDYYDERHVPRRFQRPWHGAGIGMGGWLDRPDHNKKYPDIAVPLEMESEFNIAANTNQSVWADIYIPKTAQAGVYKGVVTVSQNGTKVKDVPVELTVRKFALPDEPTSKTMLYFGYTDPAVRYFGTDSIAGLPNAATATEQWKKVRDRHFMMAHRHKISLVDQNYGTTTWADDRPRPEWEPRLNGTLFTAANGYDGPGVSTGNGVYAIGIYGTWRWLVPTGPTTQDTTQEEMWTHTDAWQQWFATNASSQVRNAEHFLFLRDEHPDLAQQQKWATWMKANPGPGKNLSSMIAGFSPMTALMQTPAVDIIASLMAVGDTTLWQNAVDAWHGRAGSKYFMYNGKRPASGSFMIDDEGIALRELPWGQYKKGVDRWFYWESTYYNNYQGNNGNTNQTNVFARAQTFGSTPFPDSLVGENTTTNPYGNGDGVLFYPGTDTKFPEESYGLQGPIASLRLKHWRRGIQDVDYIAKAKAIPGKAAAVEAIINEMVPKVLWEPGLSHPEDPSSSRVPVSWNIDPSAWESARSRLADIIDAATP